MGERSLKAYEAWREESQRFDYFLLGLIGALAAYVAQQMKPEPLGVSPFTIELAAIAALVAAAIFGFRRIEHNIGLLRQTHQRLEWEENLSSLVENFRGNPVRTNLGDVLTPDQVESRAAQLRSAIQKMNELQEASAKASGANYLRRNVCLLVGSLLVVAARVAQAYW